MKNISPSNVRVRIAPSPTGFVHIGNLRTMLYNYLFAKRYGGKFLIRIEDTDQSRQVAGALENLLDVLRWAGLENDEGPYLTATNKIQEKGEYGPYVQSQRLKIYHEQIEELLDKGKAYYCFCGKERLAQLRAEQEKNKLAPKYDGFCRNLSKQEIAAMKSNGTPYVIRFKMPENDREVIVNDEIRGAITVHTKDLDDYVLMKSDGFPTYHFASVVDDHFMKITHVLRGDEWIASAPKHVLLYEAFGWQPPKFAHLPPLLGKSRKKLSKRDGDASVQDFIEKGYLKDALLNFIALLGWNSGSEQEIYSINELTKQFSLDNIHKTGAIFDLDKLDWINGLYLRELTPEEFFAEALPYLINAKQIEKQGKDYLIGNTKEIIKHAELLKIVSLEQSRIKKLSELPEALNYFFVQMPEYNPKMLVWKKCTKEKTINAMEKLLPWLEDQSESDYTSEKLAKNIQEKIEKSNLSNGEVLWPLRVALSGREHSPGPFEIAACFGKNRTLARVKHALVQLTKLR